MKRKGTDNQTNNNAIQVNGKDKAQVTRQTVMQFKSTARAGHNQTKRQLNGKGREQVIRQTTTRQFKSMTRAEHNKIRTVSRQVKQVNKYMTRIKQESVTE